MSLLRTMRWFSVIAALGSAILLAQALSKPPNGRQCEDTEAGAPCALRDMRLPGLSLQLARSTYEVGRIAPSRAAREALLADIGRDYFVIPLYCTLFVGLGWVLGRSHPTLGAAVVACTVGAAVLDVAENLGLTAELSAGALTPWMVQFVQWTAASKWLLLFIMIAALSPLFVRRSSLIMKVTAAELIAAAILGVYGLLRQRAMVETAFLLMLAGIVLVGLAWLFAYREFGDDEVE